MSDVGEGLAAEPASRVSASVVIAAYTFDRWDQLIAAVDALQVQSRPPLEVILSIDRNRELFDRCVERWATADLAVPVPVVDKTGVGTLSNVTSVASANGEGGYCAVLVSGGVDCWGLGNNGQLGNGQFYAWASQGSAIPVAVVGSTNFGTLGGVASLVSDGKGFCATLTSGGVDCWGSNSAGQLGSGSAGYAAYPQVVVSVTNSGPLANVVSVTNSAAGYCAQLANGNDVCWGLGNNGQLGNGSFYTSGFEGSTVPVAVE